jgi:hypothetical protein
MVLNLEMCRFHWRTEYINWNGAVISLCSTSYLSFRVTAAMSAMLSDDKTADAFQIVVDRVDPDIDR